MLTPSPTTHQAGSYGTAKRLRHHVDVSDSIPDSITVVPRSVVMMMVVCDECGARFALAHDRPLQDPALAEKQAAWLKDRFVWDHIQENKHAGSIRLPGSHEIKAE